MASSGRRGSRRARRRARARGRACAERPRSRARARLPRVPAARSRCPRLRPRIRRASSRPPALLRSASVRSPYGRPRAARRRRRRQFIGDGDDEAGPGDRLLGIRARPAGARDDPASGQRLVLTSAPMARHGAADPVARHVRQRAQHVPPGLGALPARRTAFATNVMFAISTPITTSPAAGRGGGPVLHGEHVRRTQRALNHGSHRAWIFPRAGAGMARCYRR